jgi:hypothetical protein
MSNANQTANKPMQEKISAGIFTIQQILSMQKAQKWVYPDKQRGIVHTPAKRAEVLEVIISGKFCGELRLQKTGNIYQVWNGKQRTEDILWQVSQWNEKEEKILESFLNYSFPAIVHENVTDEKMLQIFEDLNGAHSCNLKSSEIAKNHVTLPETWREHSFWSKTAVSDKRADTVSVFQYAAQLLKHIDKKGNIPFVLDDYDYAPEVSAQLVSAMDYLNAGFELDEKKYLKTSSIPFILIQAIQAEAEDYSPSEFAGFVQEFFAVSEKLKKYRINFTNAQSSGTTKLEKVSARFTAIADAYQESNLHAMCYKISETRKSAIAKKLQGTIPKMTKEQKAEKEKADINTLVDKMLKEKMEAMGLNEADMNADIDLTEEMLRV